MNKTSNIEIKESKIQPKDERDRQIFRKGIIKSSRFLDNYYNPSIHKKYWNPNGCYIVKRHYNYGYDTGLSHFYEHRNVLEKHDVKPKSVDKVVVKPKVKEFIEFEFIEDNEIIVTIEHCSNCEDHMTHTNHSADGYKNFAKHIQRAILTRFPFIKVYLKPIDTEIVKHGVKKIEYLNEKYKEVNIGALEIQLCRKLNGKKESYLLHSKLTTSEWPSISRVINKLTAYVPTINLQLNVYDRENEGEEPKKNFEEAKDDDFNYSKYENIKINIYYLNIEELKAIYEKANEEVQYIVNPKKRIEFLNNTKMKILEEKPSLYQEVSYRSTLRPITGKSTFTSKMQDSVISRNTTSLGLGQQSIRPSSTTSILKSTNKKSNFNQSAIRIGTNIDLEDSDVINQYKGNLYATTFTNKHGWVNVPDLPYDSYLIEIEESKNFLVSAGIITFPKILVAKELKKYYGLRQQINAYIEIYLYHQLDKAEADLNMQLLEGATLFLIRSGAYANNAYFTDFTESKIFLKENKKIKGRYETVILTGIYILEIEKPGFEKVVKEIDFTSGENKLNIELKKEAPYKIKITVCENENFEPLENVSLKICNSSADEITMEAKTDENGVFEYESFEKNIFITISATKKGYLMSQRTFIKDLNYQVKITTGAMITSTEKLNKEQEVEMAGDEVGKNIYMILPKESSLESGSSILMITYANIFEDNFTPFFQISKEVEDIIDVNVQDAQKDIGVIMTRFQLNETEEKKTKDFEPIIRVIFEVSNIKLQKSYDISAWGSFNGLMKYGCETILYTAKNIFYLRAPMNSNKEKYSNWDLGFLDVKNLLFYETGLLHDIALEKNLFFKEWIDLLQIIIEKKLYLKLFLNFGFDKGFLHMNDRLLQELVFIRNFKLAVPYEFEIDFIYYFLDLIRNNNRMASYMIFKKKITSNLKNFHEIRIAQTMDNTPINK